MKRSLLPLACVALASCGGGSSGTAAKQPEPASSAAATPTSEEGAPAASSAKAEESPPPADVNGIPQKCAEGQADGICAPPREFVKSLCGQYPKPDVALIMFSKSAPFTHVYMNRNMEGWYTSGQQSTSAKLMFDEELVVLGHPKPKAGGMVIGNGGTNYDVLRLDGVCSSVEPEAISTRKPPVPKYANIPWQQLERNVRDALLADPGISKADANRRKECKGTTGFGVITPGCAKADDRLSAAVADYLAHGGQSPMPKASR